MRNDPQLRNAFLVEIAKSHDAAIVSLMTRAGGPEYLNLLDEARQAFLITANRALDTARTEDDGRGNNDPEAWCAWRGMMAVKEIIRKQRGRNNGACHKQKAERKTIYTGGLSEMIGENESGSLYYADPNDYAGEACVNVGFTAFLGGLRGFDRDLAMLLVYGETETISLTCTCHGPVHSYIGDIARALRCKESRVFKGLRRLRDGINWPKSAA